MTTIVAYGNFAFNFSSFDASEFLTGLTYTRTATKLVINYGGGDVDIFTGTGFAYNANGDPIAGSVFSFTDFEPVGQRALTITGLTGLPATTILAAANTATKADDQALIRTILSGNDLLIGANGIDVINGYNGNDTIRGNGNIDFIAGGLGRDIMYGGTGADDFRFFSIHEAGKGTGRDIIGDFQVGVDDIDLRFIDANGALPGSTAFSFLAAEGAAFTGVAGQVRWDQLGTGTFVFGDINGDRIADFEILLVGLKNLSQGDFLL